MGEEQRHALMKEREKMRMDEHEQLMNGLKGFLTAFKTLSQREIEPQKQTKQMAAPQPIQQSNNVQIQPSMNGQGRPQRIDIYHQHPLDPQMLNNLNAMNAIPGMPMIAG